MKNIGVVKIICSLLDELHPASKPAGGHASLIQFIQDRSGHDRRYAINPAKIEREIGWTPSEIFATGIRKTVQWYLDNSAWIQSVQSGSYRQWINHQYGKEVLS